MLNAQNYGWHLVSYRAGIYGRGKKTYRKPRIHRARDGRLVFAVLACEIINSMSRIGREYGQELNEVERKGGKEGNKRIGVETNINSKIIDFHSS